MKKRDTLKKYYVIYTSPSYDRIIVGEHENEHDAKMAMLWYVETNGYNTGDCFSVIPVEEFEE